MAKEEEEEAAIKSRKRRRRRQIDLVVADSMRKGPCHPVGGRDRGRGRGQDLPVLICESPSDRPLPGAVLQGCCRPPSEALGEAQPLSLSESLTARAWLRGNGCLLDDSEGMEGGQESVLLVGDLQASRVVVMSSRKVSKVTSFFFWQRSWGGWGGRKLVSRGSTHLSGRIRNGQLLSSFPSVSS